MSSDKLFPLKEAVKVFFPHGGATKSTLLTAISRGQLGYARIGNGYFVSETDIAKWLELCRVPAKEHVVIFSANSTNKQSISSDISNRAELAKSSALRRATELIQSSKKS